MEWDKSYSAHWRVYKVNTDTWADGEQLYGIDSVKITRTANGEALESGSMQLSGDFDTGYYRIAMTAIQGALIERIDIATLLFEEKSGNIDYDNDVRSIDGYSVLYPAVTTAVLVGEYAPRGVDGAQYAASLLTSAINAPVYVEGGFVLNDHVVHELGSSIIEAVWAVLDAGGFIIQIDGRGAVHIKPKPTEPALILDNSRMSLLQNGISYTSDKSDIPNRYIIIEKGSITVATNDDENSPVSTVNRGYFVDVVDTSPTTVNGETHAEYANKKLHQMSVLEEESSYTREYAPDVYLYDLIRASINGMNGDYRIKSQSIDCDNGVVVSEKACKETPLW